MKQPESMKPSIPDLQDFLATNPTLRQPVAVFIALLGLATFIKTLVDGFTWAFAWKGAWGVLLVISVCILCLSLVMGIIKRLMHTRPVIIELPTNYLSHKPKIRWNFDEPDNQMYTFQVLVKNADSYFTKKYQVAPGSTFYDLYKVKGLCGKLSISVWAIVDGKKYSASLPIETEIYENAIDRIIHTNRLRVAVHTDPGDDVFCSYSVAGHWQGFDIEMVNFIAAELKRKLELNKALNIEFIHYKWPEVIGVPNWHYVDFAIASISISSDRSNKYDVHFSKPYLTSELGVVFRESISNQQYTEEYQKVSLDDLQGKTVAVHNETTASVILEEYNETVRDKKNKIGILKANSNPELAEWLSDRKIDTVIYDFNRAFSMLESGLKLKKLIIAAAHQDKYGLAFAPNNFTLKEYVDEIIKDRDRDKFREMLKQHLKTT